ncbi:hypothetical protein [Streptomyces ipomoeae]|uniref:hypothetical protein n=1 Tax=Streptomyces ipomoeae TaxID=103232 RepID=UPI00114649F8|nr:hypothetical protein [Streptomyces ipomoeae]TQE33130.1 hypothetical protein Sipo7851_21790 [Streptomyces ipomoeae]
MAAIAPERPATRLPRDRNRSELTQAQRDELDRLLALLGYEYGSEADDPGYTEPAQRRDVAQRAATVAGIALPPGHEVRECYDCGLLFDAQHAHETEGFVRCGECNHTWALANDDTYGRDDTTFESRFD